MPDIQWRPWKTQYYVERQFLCLKKNFITPTHSTYLKWVSCESLVFNLCIKQYIIALHAENLSVGDISDRHGYQKYTVCNFIQKYFTTGSAGRVKGSGFKRMTTSAEDRLITRISLRDRFKIAVNVRREFNGWREDWQKAEFAQWDKLKSPLSPKKSSKRGL